MHCKFPPAVGTNYPLCVDVALSINQSATTLCALVSGVRFQYFALRFGFGSVV